MLLALRQQAIAFKVCWAHCCLLHFVSKGKPSAALVTYLKVVAASLPVTLMKAMMMYVPGE